MADFSFPKLPGSNQEPEKVRARLEQIVERDVLSKSGRGWLVACLDGAGRGFSDVDVDALRCTRCV